MTYDVYRMIFFIAGGLSIAMFAVSVFLFFFFKIPKLIGDLSGRSAAKAIEKIKTQTANTTVFTGAIQSSAQTQGTAPTEALASETEVLSYAGTTEVLFGETTMLEQTPVLAAVACGETTVIDETTFLHSSGVIE